MKIERCRICDRHSSDPCHNHASGQGLGCRQNLDDSYYEHPEIDLGRTLNSYAKEIHTKDCHTWWHDPVTGKKNVRNKGELLMLMVSELAEAMEGERKDKMDDHLPHRKMAEVELADCLIRIFDYAGAYGFDLDCAVAEKRAYNAQRADHKPENRAKEGGKKW